MNNDWSDDTATEPDARAGQRDAFPDTGIKSWNIVEPVETSKDYGDAVRARGGTVVSLDSTDSMAFDPYDTSDGAIAKGMTPPR